MAGLDADPAVYTARVLIAEMTFARAEHTKERIHRFGHLHLDDFADRADRFQNELIVVGHVTSRDEPAAPDAAPPAGDPPPVVQRIEIA